MIGKCLVTDQLESDQIKGNNGDITYDIADTEDISDDKKNNEDNVKDSMYASPFVWVPLSL